MSFNSCVNRVFLAGYIDQEPEFKKINGESLLCFTLVTSDTIKKKDKNCELLEYHNIQVPFHCLQPDVELRESDWIYIQGRIRTRKIIENDVKIYKCEIIAMTVEPLTESKIMQGALK